MSQDGEAGFFSRWSRRKGLARQGTPMPEPVRPESALPMVPVAPPAPAPAPATQPQPQLQLEPEPPQQPPTLADVAALTPESDYSRFVAAEVEPEVKNAALQKLFSDPHYNVMDGLDTYIDDYSQPDPLPPGMLEKMTQSVFLGLFTAAPAATPFPAAPPEPLPSPAPNENPDLRLQPDDAAERAGPAQDPAERTDGHPGREP